MGRRLIEAVPNFSEGRDPAVIDAIAAACSAPGACLLDGSSDVDHNRMVLTLAGEPEAVAEACLHGVEAAAKLIDLPRHRGVHPRIGAADVLPFVPVEGITLEECAALAHRTGEEIWRTFQIPVYFYGAAARDSASRTLEVIRRGDFRPDLGEGRHPTAGAIVVGARKFLIAYNVNLETPDVNIARLIARRIRSSSGGLPHVKALGLYLEARNQAQVSMNLTDFEVTPIHAVFQAVEREASLHGIDIAGSELIGLIPRRAIDMTAGVDLRWERFSNDSIFENRLEAALQSAR